MLPWSSQPPLGSTVTGLTVETITSNDYTATSTTVGLVAVTLLLILLLIDSVRRADGEPPRELQALLVGIVPLLVAVSAVIGGRLVSLL